MGKPTTLEERMQILTLAQAGFTDPAIAQQIGCSPVTVRKWRRRGMRQGRAGLASSLGRPRRGALSSAPSRVSQGVRAWREAHPGWGPKTLRAELVAAPGLALGRVPSRATLARFLKQEGLTRSYARHSELPLTPRGAATAPHEEWEMDARGWSFVPHVGMVSLIHLNDRYSRVRLQSYPCLLGKERVERHPTTRDYQIVLRLTFTEWGLPDRLAVDHESVFFDNETPSPFPTLWHLWLLALGVGVTFGRIGQPTDQAITERSHQLWTSQVLAGQEFADWHTLYRALGARREFLNRCLPCAARAEVPPLIASPEATRPRRAYRPEWEAALLDLGRVYAYLAQGRWFRRASSHGAVTLGTQRYYLGVAWVRHQVEITFDPADQHLVCRDETGEQEKRLPLKGVTVNDLMGECGPLFSLPGFQLTLPFSWTDWHAVRLYETLAGTTS
jgi:transposase